MTIAPPTAPSRRKIASLEVLCGVIVLALLAPGSLIQRTPTKPYEF